MNISQQQGVQGPEQDPQNQAVLDHAGQGDDWNDDGTEEYKEQMVHEQGQPGGARYDQAPPR